MTLDDIVLLIKSAKQVKNIKDTRREVREMGRQKS